MFPFSAFMATIFFHNSSLKWFEAFLVSLKKTSEIETKKKLDTLLLFLACVEGRFCKTKCHGCCNPAIIMKHTKINKKLKYFL